VSNAVKVLIAVVVFVGAFVGSQAFYKMTRTRTPQEIQAQVEQDVASLKPTLPQEVHPLVTWFDIEAGPQTMIYKYKVKAPRATIVAKRAEMEAEMAHGFTSWAITMMLPRDVHAQAELYDQNGKYVYTLDLK
jgi:hypothetical protein